MSNSLLFPLLRMLSDGRFHSGEKLATHFKVTRATIWNALSEAENLGVKVFSVRGKGYKLPEPLTLLDKQAVLQTRPAKLASLNLEIHDQLDSTNALLLGKAGHGASHLTAIAASHQTQGRGRRGRVWQSALGDSLTFSLLWRFQCGAAALSGLSLAIGVALIRALRELGIDNARLKWPNDVLIDQRKLAGILIELQGDMESASAAVIGVGINMHMPASLKQQIDQPAIGLQEVTSKIDPNHVLGVVLGHMLDVIGQFDQTGFSVLRSEWENAHAYQQQSVRMIMPNGSETTGIAQGVDDSGVLLIQTPEGERRFASGEVSLRGVSV